MRINFYKIYEKNYIFEGNQREIYHNSIQKWLVLSCFSVIFPLLITLITDSYGGKFNINNLINNGDFILLSFSLTIPTALDLFGIMKNTNEKNNLIKSRYLCLFIIVVQVLFYACIRTNNAKFLSNLISTIVIMLVSIYLCRYFIFCMFINSIDESEG